MNPERDVEHRLGALRERLESIDRQIVHLIAERVELAREIGREKAAAGLPTLDPSREVEIVGRATLEAREVGLDAEAVRDIAWRLVGLSRRAQQDDRSASAKVS